MKVPVHEKGLFLAWCYVRGSIKLLRLIKHSTFCKVGRRELQEYVQQQQISCVYSKKTAVYEVHEEHNYAKTLTAGFALLQQTAAESRMMRLWGIKWKNSEKQQDIFNTRASHKRTVVVWKIGKLCNANTATARLASIPICHLLC